MGAALLLLGLGACMQGPLAPVGGPSPAGPDKLLQEGTLLLRTGEPAMAYRRFISALGAGGDPARALTGAGLALEAQGQLHQARDYLERARALAPNSVTALNNLGAVHYKLGDFAAARQAFRAAFAISSGRSGIAAANLNATEKAIAARAPRAPIEVTHRLQRLGGGVYTLMPVGETEEPVPPEMQLAPDVDSADLPAADIAVGGHGPAPRPVSIEEVEAALPALTVPASGPEDTTAETGEMPAEPVTLAVTDASADGPPVTLEIRPAEALPIPPALAARARGAGEPTPPSGPAPESAASAAAPAGPAAREALALPEPVPPAEADAPTAPEAQGLPGAAADKPSLPAPPSGTGQAAPDGAAPPDGAEGLADDPKSTMLRPTSPGHARRSTPCVEACLS
ncbi:hypothetical protein LNKW23_21540 [Paralimibaculum aggregatum]|uniref:Tetratricopeptide repeat protein n=1 Tax=Paralimibaculum aggregatum TaxID=3036245 RepID=A0ABQ6LQH2_9RHOB|nr:tetratricopeptide repeat protein [Limibaculum sp. NKW23]GMG82941.1 hypothetical protein LNKW23_21540 [Limibaculum sp. NKW23]